MLFYRTGIWSDRGLANYWGYSTLAYFAPNRPIWSTARTNCGSRFARCMLRGSRSYWTLFTTTPARVANWGRRFPGVVSTTPPITASRMIAVILSMTRARGHALNLSHPRVMQMVMDLLRYWSSSFHVDGFRFDLGATLATRRPGILDPGAAILRCDPAGYRSLSQLKLISEPWDLGPGGYRAGQSPAALCGME